MRGAWIIWTVVALCALAHPVRGYGQANAPPPPAATDIPDAPSKEEPKKEESPLAADPKTPLDLFEATVLMLDIARPTLARAYLDRLLAENPDDATLLEIRDKFGSAPFVRLTNSKELQPSATKLLEMLNAATAKRAADPERLAMLLQNLTGTIEEQVAAREELAASGTLIIPALIKVLSDAGQSARHESVLDVLMQIGEPAVPALLGAISAPHPELRAQVITLLGHLRADVAIPYLYASAVSEGEAPVVRSAARSALSKLLNLPLANIERLASAGVVPRLLQIAREHYRGQYVWEPNADSMVSLWVWSSEDSTVLPVQLDPQAASEILGARFSREALTLAPERRDAQVLYLSLALAGDARRVGIEHRLPSGPGTAHDLALSVGPEVVGDVLAEALTSGRPNTAVAALQVLEQIGTATLLKGTTAKRSPVTMALNYPDRRVQFAAAVTVLQIDPASTFAEAPRVVSILNRAMSNTTRPHVVVADPSSEHGSAIGGLLTELGYSPLLVNTGKDAFRLASERQDVELVVLHPNIIRWALTETLANLRADARTGSLPVLLLGPASLRPNMKVHLANYRMIEFAAESQTAADLELQIGPWLKQLQTAPLSETEQVAQRAAAVDWLAHIAGGRRTRIFDIAPAAENLGLALDDSLLSASAVQALGEISSATSQRRLATLVLDASAIVRLRETAAIKLAFHIQRFGLLLERTQIDGLHQAAGAANIEPELHTALLGVIGSLKPDASLVGKRLQSFSSK